MRKILLPLSCLTFVFTTACGAGADVESAPTATVDTIRGDTTPSDPGPAATSDPAVTPADTTDASESPGGDAPTGSAPDGTLVIPADAQGPVLRGDTQTISADCRGETAYVTGDFNAVTLTGPCPDVEIWGMTNTVVILGAADSITITGDFNSVDVDTVGSVVVDGSTNSVTYASGTDGTSPKITDSSDFNSIGPREA